MPELDSTIRYGFIPDFPDYQVGTDGSVWTCKKRGTVNLWYLSDEWTRMKPKVERQGYLRLTLCVGGSETSVSVHRLVLETFVGPCPEGFQCRHLDGNPLNCHLENLAWGSVQENHDDKQRHGTTARGERLGRSKLTEDQVYEIRWLARIGFYTREIGKLYDVSSPNVSAIIRRKTWGHLLHHDPVRFSTPEYLPMSCTLTTSVRHHHRMGREPNKIAELVRVEINLIHFILSVF